MNYSRERQRCLVELNLPPHASDDDIRKAYLQEARKYHPDKNQDSDATDRFQKINAAYRFLTEGDQFVHHMMDDHMQTDEDDLFWAFRYMFPWLFTPTPTQHYYPNFRQQTYFDYDESSEEEYYEEKVFTSKNPQPKNESAWSQQFYPPRNESGVSQHYRQHANFTTANQEHGEYFRGNKKSAKKQNRGAKRAEKIARDSERPKSRNSEEKFTNDFKQADKTPAAKPTTPESANNQSPAQTKESESSNNIKVEEQTPKKSKKQIQLEQKQREKELNEIRELLEEQERVRKEKMEKKRAAQEEKERKEREAREEEERKRQEIEEKKEAEKRKLREIEEKRRRLQQEEAARKRKEEERMKALMAEFDKNTFLDESGDFKYTDPDLTNIIKRKDKNPLGDANKEKPVEKLNEINGIKAEDLIKLQKDNLKENAYKPIIPQEKQTQNQANLNHTKNQFQRSEFLSNQPKNQFQGNEFPSNHPRNPFQGNEFPSNHPRNQFQGSEFPSNHLRNQFNPHIPLTNPRMSGPFNPRYPQQPVNQPRAPYTPRFQGQYPPVLPDFSHPPPPIHTPLRFLRPSLPSRPIRTQVFQSKIYTAPTFAPRIPVSPINQLN
ncbi:uncharacterized protein LOC131943235 [Physella acuta]|uniref:uncharacterized protein LOC131943235 n=1 Tax=Physella acuta TaxID=109671 RepID=UPI0027DB7A8A|nr:uncharacterized protein LOC131943235 [Physella acuta]XP_059159235.1 uncharacterized protein LOC131943235 [Physella acuta]